MSRTRAPGDKNGRRVQQAEACMCGAEMVAEWPMDCGESE